MKRSADKLKAALLRAEAAVLEARRVAEEKALRVLALEATLAERDAMIAEAAQLLAMADETIAVLMAEKTELAHAIASTSTFEATEQAQELVAQLQPVAPAAGHPSRPAEPGDGDSGGISDPEAQP